MTKKINTGSEYVRVTRFSFTGAGPLHGICAASA